MRSFRKKHWRRLAVIAAFTVALSAPATAAFGDTAASLTSDAQTYEPGKMINLTFSVNSSVAEVYVRIQQGSAGAMMSSQLVSGSSGAFEMSVPSNPGTYTANLYDSANFRYLVGTSFTVAGAPASPLPAMLMVPNAGSDATNNPDAAAANEVRNNPVRYNTIVLYQDPAEPAGTFKIEDALTHRCLADDDPAVTPYWEDCLEGSTFYLAPALRGYGFFVKSYAEAAFEAESVHGAPSYCLSNNGQIFASASWTPKLVNCKDGIDGTDPLSTAGAANSPLSSMTWNFYHPDGTPLPDATALPELPSSSPVVHSEKNVIKMCNWAAMVVYYKVEYTLNGGASQTYQSGTYDVGQCGELDLPAGYLNATATVVVQMEAAGSWAPMEATTFIGWSTDATIQVNGNVCSDSAYITGSYRNDAASFTVDPGTDCWTDSTNGQPHTATYADMWNYLMTMNPFTALGGSAPSMSVKMAGLSGLNVSAFKVGASNLGTNLFRLGFSGAHAATK